MTPTRPQVGQIVTWWCFGRSSACILAFAALLACEQPPPSAAAIVPPLVRVAVVTGSEQAGDLQLSGTLDAKRFLPLSFSVMGTVEQVLVQEGVGVKPGQVLARISPRSYQDAVSLAKLKVDQAEDAYQRLKPMHDEGALPEVKLVEVQTGRDQARLALAMAQKNLDDTALRAPVAGIVVKRSIEPGSSAMPGVPAVTLMQATTLLATAPVPEKQVGQVTKGDAARVVVPAMNRTIEATVSEVGTMADPLTRTYEVKIEIPNADQDLRVGMVANVQLRRKTGSRALVVPPEAVRIDELGDPCVYVVAKDGRVQRRPVKVIGYVGESTALASGVAEGERVVISGTPMLADGTLVRVLERQTDGA